MAVFLLPIIQIYTKGINDAEYTNRLLLILFVIMNLISNCKIPVNSVIEFAGDFKKTRSFAIWEMILNLSVSVVAIVFLGICGAILGTIVALVYRSIVTIYHTNKMVLNRKQFLTYKTLLLNVLVFLVVLAVFYVDSFSNYSFGKLLINGVVHSVWIIVLYVLTNFIFNKTAFKTVFEFYRGKKNQ